MNCDEFAEVATDLVKKQPVDSEKKLRALTHADVCPRCSNRLEQEQDLTACLRDLAGAMASEEAPAHLEDRLLSQFRRLHETSEISTKRGWYRSSGVIAAGIILLIVSGYLVMIRPPHVDKPQLGTDSEYFRSRADTPVDRRIDKARPQVVTGFIPLVEGYYKGAPERGHVLRVRLDRTALLWMGLPMNEELAETSILADVLIGDDGLAQAVRFVR